MSNLNAFLHPVSGDETKEVIISKRFIGEDGKPAPFKIRALTQEENAKISRQSMKPVKFGKHGEKELDPVEYSDRLIVAATLEPKFDSEEMVRHFGVLDPIKVPGRMLLAGEYKRLTDAVMELSGFTGDAEDDAKN